MIEAAIIVIVVVIVVAVVLVFIVVLIIVATAIFVLSDGHDYKKDLTQSLSGALSYQL